MPVAPVNPLSLDETPEAFRLVLPRACDSPPSEIECTVQAFREAIARVYAIRTLRAAQRVFQNDPETPPFVLRWTFFAEHGEHGVSVQASDPYDPDLFFEEGAGIPEEVWAEAGGVHSDPEVVAHLNGWFGNARIAANTVSVLARIIAGQEWDRVAAHSTAEHLKSTAPTAQSRTRKRPRV